MLEKIGKWGASNTRAPPLSISRSGYHVNTIVVAYCRPKHPAEIFNKRSTCILVCFLTRKGRWREIKGGKKGRLAHFLPFLSTTFLMGKGPRLFGEKQGKGSAIEITSVAKLEARIPSFAVRTQICLPFPCSRTKRLSQSRKSLSRNLFAKLSRLTISQNIQFLVVTAHRGPWAEVEDCMSKRKRVN